MFEGLGIEQHNDYSTNETCMSYFRFVVTFGKAISIFSLTQLNELLDERPF